jgi:transcriptional regulator with XRE-family HTH domain
MTTSAQRLVRFGAALQALRVERGYSRAALARCAGLSDHQLGRIERGEAPVRIAVAVSLARSLGVTVHSLCAYFEPTPEEQYLRELFAVEFA